MHNNLLMPILAVAALFFLLPWISMLFFGFLLVLLIVAGALGFALTSARWFIDGPRQVKALLRSSRARQNLALMHGLSNLLASRGIGPVTGYSSPQGFCVQGALEEHLIYETALEALQRLRNGERELAVSSVCPTSKLISNLSVTLLLMLLLALSHQAGLLSLFLAALAGQVLGPVLSPWLQKAFLATRGLDGLQILSVTYREGEKTILAGRFRAFVQETFVATGYQGASIEAEIVD